MNPQVSIETITPQIAEQMLAKKTHNRPLNKWHVLFLVQQMRDGLWKVNNDAITFDANGDNINGQHRLTAVIKSGVTIEVLVLRHVPDDVFETMDSGRNRRAADILAIEGHKNTYTLASALRVVRTYYEGTMPTLKTPTNREAREWIGLYPGLVDSVSWAITIKTCRLLSGTYWAASHYILTHISPDEGMEFLARLASGADLKVGEPVHVLRKRLEDNLSKKAKYPSTHLFAFLIKAWNAQRKNVPLGILRYKHDAEYQEEFPVAI